MRAAERFSSWGVLASQAIDLGAQTAASVLVARALGPELNGEIVFALGLSGLLATLVLFGTGEIALAMHARGAQTPDRVLGAQLVVWAGGSTSVGALAAVIAIALGLGASTYAAVALAVATLVANAAASSLGLVLMARSSAHRDVGSMAASRALLLGGVILTAGAHDPRAVLGVHLLAASVLVALRARSVRRELGSLRVRFDRAVLREMIARGRSIGLGSILGAIAARADTIVLRALAGAEATGLYGAYYRVLNALGALATAASLALFPSLVRSVGTSGARRALVRFALVPLALALVALLAAWLAEPLIRALYGAEFVSDVPTFRVLLVAGAVQASSAFLHRALVAWKLERSLPLAQGAQALVNVVLNLWLVPLHGPMGAAIATLACELVTPLVHLVVHAPRSTRPALDGAPSA